STAILVRALRSLGAHVDWYLPSRLEDGYGLSARTVERLAARGTALLVTADCAITAVAEVASARAAGMDVVVTDHHAPRADGCLPEAPIVHPALCDYPCPQLCAAAVADELDRVNAERRHVEERIRFEAEARVAEHGDQPAYVLAGEGWHPGVVGIVASRIAERHHRPTVLVALDGGRGTGSGRSIP